MSKQNESITGPFIQPISIAGKLPVDYVNPNIGTIGHLLTATEPIVSLPHGMTRV